MPLSDEAKTGLGGLANRLGKLSGMTGAVVIYVELLNEGVETWRPVAAIAEEGGIYLLPDEQGENEEWAFPPGSRVRRETRELSGGFAQVAVSLAE